MRSFVVILMHYSLNAAQLSKHVVRMKSYILKSKKRQVKLCQRCSLL